jgi:predicted HTH transcriptional regulator
MISLQTFLDNYGALFQQVLYLLEDNKTTPYIKLKQKIEEKNIERKSELDEFYLYTEIKELNQYAESSRAIVGKTVNGLDKKALNSLFKTEQTKNHFLKHKINRNASVETKLKELYLMSNGYVIKGTYLCLCSASEIRAINTTADYISFGVYDSLDRTKIKIADDFHGNLIYQFEQAESALLLALGSLQIIDLLKRISDYSIPAFVVRELIANAIVHRDYSENANIHTTIELYTDRFVVRNAGKFPDHINPDDIENIQSKPINKEIARIFFLHGIVQKKGSVIQRVQTKLKEREKKLYFSI